MLDATCTSSSERSDDCIQSQKCLAEDLTKYSINWGWEDWGLFGHKGFYQSGNDEISCLKVVWEKINLLGNLQRKYPRRGMSQAGMEEERQRKKQKRIKFSL